MFCWRVELFLPIFKGFYIEFSEKGKIWDWQMQNHRKIQCVLNIYFEPPNLAFKHTDFRQQMWLKMRYGKTRIKRVRVEYFWCFFFMIENFNFEHKSKFQKKLTDFRSFNVLFSISRITYVYPADWDGPLAFQKRGYEGA